MPVRRRGARVGRGDGMEHRGMGSFPFGEWGGGGCEPMVERLLVKPIWQGEGIRRHPRPRSSKREEHWRRDKRLFTPLAANVVNTHPATNPA